MIGAAKKHGYAYVGISDHSFGLRIANGLSPERQAKQRKELDALSKQFPDIEILQGAETEILARVEGQSMAPTLADQDRLIVAAGCLPFAARRIRLRRRQRGRRPRRRRLARY